MAEDVLSALDLSNCDKEPIHIPGTIQPFGTLLAGGLALDQIEYAGANCSAILSTETAQVLGSSFIDVLGNQPCHDIRNVLSFSTARSQRERVGTYDIGGLPVEIFAHVNVDRQAVLELERPEAAGVSREQNPIDQMRALISKASKEPTVERLLKTATAGLYALTGYDRVKAYRYARDGSGEVVAESRGADTDSFLGLRYPAWDVPTQARALQIKNPVRMLSDINQTPVPVLAHDTDAASLNLSLAHLRGISVIHTQYLKNMGVGATLTLGLVVDGALWGMFACHHMSPKVISSDTRIAAELFAQMISLLVKEKIELATAQTRAEAAEARRNILANSDATTDFLHAFPWVSAELRKVVDCDGLAILKEDHLLTDGSVPASEAIREIADYRADEDNLVESTDFLTESGWISDPDGTVGDTGGCLLVRATAAFPLQLMFFRDQTVRKVTWAGRPDKVLEDGPFGPRLTPRGSFDAYIEEQHGRCEPWEAADLVAASEIQTMLTHITARSEQAELTRHKDLLSHQRQQDLMIAELNHRVKNILALIRSLSRQAKASAASLESYAKALEQRIAALSAAHDLAVMDAMQGVSLRSIVETELNPYRSEDGEQFVLSGPIVGLRADVAPMVALVLHEVTSNAAKYGALSTKDGIVQVRWSVDDSGLSFNWRELGGPKVKPPSRHGFGRSLIEKAIPYEFDGLSSLEYDESGVRFSFTLPSKVLVDLKKDSEAVFVGRVGDVVRVASGKRVLMVEDNLVLAIDMVETLTRMGAESIETAGTTEAALKQIISSDFDFAVLDMNLRGVVSFDIADRLIEKKIPFVFVTGYGSKIDVPPHLSQIAILTKPVDDTTISGAIENLLKG